MTEESLSQDEVENLLSGTEVMITWSGGNGPHKYIIGRHFSGLCVYNQSSDFIEFLTFVGKENYHTKVWLIK